MKCSKCKTLLQKNSRFCPVCGTKVKKYFRGKLLVVVVIGILGCLGVTGLILGLFEEIPSSALQEANQKCIFVEECDITMENQSEGTANIVIHIPHYEKLFHEASKHINPEKYILDMLESDEYPKQKREEVARVVIENGKTVVHSEEVVNKVVAESIIHAINALSEVEE